MQFLKKKKEENTEVFLFAQFLMCVHAKFRGEGRDLKGGGPLRPPSVILYIRSK